MAIYLKNIDLSKNQLLNATLHPTGTAPTTTAAGQVYFDTSAAPTKGLYVHNGTVWTPVRVQGGVGVDLAGSDSAPVYDIDFTATSLSAVTTNQAADIFAMYDDSVSGHRSITFGDLESNLTIANMIGGGTVGTVTSVTAGAGMTQSGTSTINPTLDVVSAAGSAGTIGTLTVTANAVGVDLGSTSTTAAPGNHTHTLSTGATDVNATASEVNLLDLSAQSVTSGEVLIGTGVSTAAWSTISTADLSNSSNVVLNNQVNTYTVGKQTFIASSTGTASIRIQSGVDPTTPVAGDIWLQGDNLKYEDSTASRTLIYSGGAFHDGFSDFVANEHVDHSNIDITLNNTANETSVTGAGQSIDSNVTFTVGIADNAIMPGTGGMIPVAGTTAQRVTRTGNFRYNTTDDIVEWYTGTGWARPDTGGGEANQDAFSIVTGDTGTATADAVSDSIAITGGTGIDTVATAGAAAALTINFDLTEATNTATTSLDYVLLADQSASEGIIKRDAGSFITDQGIALLASPALSGNPTAPTPTTGDNDTSIATTAFVQTAVDNATNDIDYKESSRAASTTNVSVTYNSTGGTSSRGRITAVTDTIDGVSLAANDRVLLKNQSTGAQNGIWEVLVVGTGANGEWERTEDFDEDSEVTSGAYTFIEEGTANASSGWRLTTVDPITIGGASGTSLTFTQVSGAGQITAGDAMVKTGNVLDVLYDGTSIDVDGGDNLRIDPTWTGQGTITTVGALSSGSIAVGFTAIPDARLETISTANKVSGSAVQLATNTAIEDSSGLKLKAATAGTGLTLSVAQVLDVAQADATTEGIVELATKTESEAATDTGRAVTPEGLASYARVFTKACAATATTTVTHNLGHRNVQVEVYRTGTPWDTVHCDVARPTTDTVDVTITPTPTAGLYTIVVTGAADAATAAS